MAIDLRRRRILPDGRVENFSPMKNGDGYYILADRAVDAQHNKSVNQFFVRDIEAVAARVRAGGVSVRMRGDITGQPNLISAGEIEVVGDRAPEAAEDPFATFTEWASEADEMAYRDL